MRFLYAPSKPKLVDSTAHNQCFSFLVDYDFSQFLSKMVKMSISQETPRSDFEVNNWPIMALKMSKEAF